MANYRKLLSKMTGSAAPPGGSKHVSAGSTRRRVCGAVAVICLTIAVVGDATGTLERWTGSEPTSRFLVSALARIGLVFGAMWLAWDSVKRPARWLPPGLALLGVISLVIIAAQPKLIFAILPLVGIVTVFTSLLRVFRRN